MNVKAEAKLLNSGGIELTTVFPRGTMTEKKRTWIEVFGSSESLSILQTFRATGIPRRTLYNWLHGGHVEHVRGVQPYRIPVPEVRLLMAGARPMRSFHR